MDTIIIADDRFVSYQYVAEQSAPFKGLDNNADKTFPIPLVQFL